jgi:hypothetical protein
MAIKVMDLPMDLVYEILSYGDVVVTEKYEGVLRQLKYHKKEFMYQRNNNPLSQWYFKPDSYYTLYILMKNQMKKHLDKYIYTSKPSRMYNINCVFTQNYDTNLLINYNNMIDINILLESLADL